MAMIENCTFNRTTRVAWLTVDGKTIATTLAGPGEKMTDVAGALMAEHNFRRTSDWMLVAGGSPLRQAAMVRETNSR